MLSPLKITAVPYFKVLVNGRGLEIPGVGNQPVIRGFFTTRIVRTTNAAVAAERALESVRVKWFTETQSSSDRGTGLVLHAEEVSLSSFVASFRAKTKGYTFYSQEENDA